MKKFFIIYSVVVVLFCGYIAVMLGLFTMDDPKATFFDFFEMFVITFGLPVMLLVWFPMRLICMYKRKKSAKSKDKLDTIDKINEEEN